MDVSLKQNRQMRSLSIAMGASIVAAAATMFVPVNVLESITGATGLSEIVGAAAAPLGDKARALIAFGAGALTLAAMTVMLLRKDAGPTNDDVEVVAAAGFAPLPGIVEDEDEDDDDDDGDRDGEPLSLMERLFRLRLPALSLPKMPWLKGENDITELGDLLKLRNGDIHPDAPPRRPLSATQDLPVLDLAEMQIEGFAEKQPEALVEVDAVVLPSAVYEPSAPVEHAASDFQPSLAEMVAQLESAVNQRQQQLAALEIVAAQLAAEKPAEDVAVPLEMQVPDVVANVETLPEPARAERPPLEAVPTSPEKQDDMDAALTAALATLHRMNGTDR